MKKIHILILSGLVLSGVSCKNQKTEEKAQEVQVQTDNNEKEKLIVISKAQFKANDMQLGEVKTDTFYQKITAQGVLDVPPSNKAVMSSYMPGKVRNVKLIVGDKVRKGQLLVQVTNPDYIKMQQDYLQAKENLAYLKQEYERQKQLAAEKVVSQKKLQDAQRNYFSAKARYNGLKEQLKMLHINLAKVEAGNLTSTVNLYAPISGYISKLFVTEGSAVNEADKIMEIINNDHTHLELRVFEKDIMKLKKGQEISYKVPGVDNKVYKGYIKLIGREVDPETRSVLVHGHLEEPHPNFIAGIYIEAKIYIDKHPGKSVSSTAIIKDEEYFYVLRLIHKDENDFEFEKVPIQVLEEENRIIHVRSQVLKTGDTILNKGGFFLIGVEAGGGHSH